jgi:hypothetical protein
MSHSPFRSEAAAFRFVLLTLVAFGAVAAAAWAVGPSIAVPVWAALSAVAAVLYTRRGRRARLLATAPPHVGAGEHRLLLVAQATPAAETLRGVGERASRVLVVAPAAPSRLRRWLSDVDGAREQARQRAEASVVALREAKVEASGSVGDEDPVRAVEDALRTFGGDEIVVATARGAGGEAVAARIGERFALPVTHVAG